MITPDSDYRDVLEEEFTLRCRRNPSYSLRAFARDLGIAHSRVSELFNRRCGISRNVGAKISKKLGFSETKQEIFLLLIDIHSAKGPRQKKAAIEQLGKLLPLRKEGTLAPDLFQLIADWYHYAILELFSVKDFKNNPTWIAKRLGIRRDEAENAIARLLRLGLLKKTASALVPSDDFTITPGGVPSKAYKNYHEQLLIKAQKALFEQSIDHRDISSVTMAMSSQQMTKAKELIKNFRREFSKIIESDPEKDRIYCLSVQFFGLDRTELAGAAK